MAKKLYYKIGEACKRLDIQPYVLRYWETEFPVLAPSKSTSGQRVYSEQDLRVIQRIKELLYEEGYTIAGAKKKLEKEDPSSLGEVRAAKKKPAPEPAPAEAAESDDAAPVEPGASEPRPKAKAGAKAKPVARPKSKPKTRKTAAQPTSSASEARLRRGIRDALKEAQAILDILDTG